MKLLTQEVLSRLPALGSQENEKDPIVQVKFFTPDAGWTWYATEGSPEGDDFIFFGYVQGVEPEWGYFSLRELRTVRGALGLPVERDLHFDPRPMSQVVK
jgi:hypothetical protein